MGGVTVCQCRPPSDVCSTSLTLVPQPASGVTIRMVTRLAGCEPTWTAGANPARARIRPGAKTKLRCIQSSLGDVVLLQFETHRGNERLQCESLPEELLYRMVR